MKQTDFLIVGGSAAGTTAAGVIRSLMPEATITIITDQPYEFYSLVLIPHYISHKVTREHVFLKTADWYVQKNIVFLKGVRAQHLEPSRKEVTCDNGEVYQYKKLLITVGGKLIPLQALGVELENILYMRTLDDADKIIKAASAAKSGIIIGGGFIGLELIGCFRANGIKDIKVLVMEPYFWQGKLDENSSKVLTATLEKNGVQVLVNKQVDHFVGDGKVSGVVTKSGDKYDVQVVGIGIGIRLDLDWLKDSGIAAGRGILTNEFLETNLPDVYAAGDCAEFKDVLFERQHILGNWANATSQGTAVGKTMVHSASSGQAGEKTVFQTASSYTSNYFDGSCSFIGVTDDKFADEILSRGSVESGKMTRIYIKSIQGVTRIVGATVVNNPSEVPILTSLIKGKTDIMSFKKELTNASFDLRQLLQ